MARPAVKYDDNFEEIANELRRAGIKMQEAAVETLNLGAEYIESKYKGKLRQQFTIRNNYTTGAVRRLRATSHRRGGRELRRMRDVNAVVGVRKLRGGAEHYLLMQEEGGTKRGYRSTAGKVPVPLDAARTGSNRRKPVASKFRINRANIRQMNNLRGMNARQQYGAMRARLRRGEISSNDLVQTEHGMFQVMKRKVKLVRSVGQSRVRIRGRHMFRDSVHTLTERRMIQSYQITARRLLRQAGLPN